MSYVFQGDSIEDFVVVSGALGSDLGNTTAVQPAGETAFRRGSVFMNTTNAVLATPVFSPLLDEAWVHFQFSRLSTANSQFSNRVAQFRDGADDVWMQIDASNGVWNVEINTAGSLTAVGISATSTTITAINNDIFDIRHEFDGAGNVDVDFFLNSVLVGSYSGPVVADSNATSRVTFHHPQNFDISTSRFAEFIMTTNIPTVGARLLSLGVDGEGPATDFTGSITDLNAFDSDDTGFMTVNLIGDEHEFTLTDPPAAASVLNPVTLKITARAQAGAAPPASLDLGISSGASTDVTNVSTGLGFSNVSVSYDFNNPFTGAAWTIADLDGLNIYTQGQA